MTLEGGRTDASLYGNAHAIVLDHMQVVDMVISNFDTGTHPFHLHGHVFQVVDRGSVPFTAVNSTKSNPLQRDTIVIPTMEYAVLRFTADNPGTWLMHCHIEWHLQSGLAVTFIEAPERIKGPAPQAILDQCKPYGVSGNANGKDGADMTGYLFTAGLIQYGFSVKGGASFAACVLACVLGIAIIIWFGREDAVKN